MLASKYLHANGRQQPANGNEPPSQGVVNARVSWVGFRHGRLCQHVLRETVTCFAKAWWEAESILFDHVLEEREGIITTTSPAAAAADSHVCLTHQSHVECSPLPDALTAPTHPVHHKYSRFQCASESVWVVAFILTRHVAPVPNSDSTLTRRKQGAMSNKLRGCQASCATFPYTWVADRTNQLTASSYFSPIVASHL